MRVLTQQVIDDNGTTETLVEHEHGESLLAYDTDGFYKVGPYIVSGHDVGVMQRVAWDAVAQEWKVQR